MVVEHNVREHARDGGDTHVDEYSRGSGRKVGRFRGTFSGISGRFEKLRAERAEAKDEADLALSREEYLSEQERLEQRRAQDEQRAYAATHRPSFRSQLSSAARTGYAAYRKSQKAPPRRKSRKTRSKSRRRRDDEIFPDTPIYR